MACAAPAWSYRGCTLKLFLFLGRDKTLMVIDMNKFQEMFTFGMQAFVGDIFFHLIGHQAIFTFTVLITYALHFHNGG